MSASTPSARWQWLVNEQLQLDTGVLVQTTPFRVQQLIEIEDKHFSLEQAQS